MASCVSGITFVSTNDDMLFPFSTDFLVQHPISLILSNIVGFTMYNGVKVVKVGISSTEIQTYMVLITGFTLQPLSDYKEQTYKTHDNCESHCSTQDITYKGDGLDILDNDEEFADFDSFVSSR